MKVGIIGGGTFGCIVGRALKEEGCKVTIYDCNRALAASRASGFLMKPSWFDGLGSKITEPSLELLDKLYGLQKIKFKVGPIKTFAYRIDREQVLNDTKLTFVNERVTVDELKEKEYDLIIVAAGVWSGRLVNGIEGLEGKQGISFEWKGQIEKNKINPWAPYKQIVVFNVPGSNKVWGGDGSAILSQNWSASREQECADRVAKVADMKASQATRFVGIRPYIKDVKPCLVEKRGKRLWVVTGGAKNGTIAAGWAAHKIIKEAL